MRKSTKLKSSKLKSSKKVRHVIVRSRDAGVLFGEFVSLEGDTVVLDKAIQLWRWHAARGITLLDVAEFGVITSDDKCKFSAASQVKVTIMNACAVIECSQAAVKSIMAV